MSTTNYRWGVFQFGGEDIGGCCFLAGLRPAKKQHPSLRFPKLDYTFLIANLAVKYQVCFNLNLEEDELIKINSKARNYRLASISAPDFPGRD
jgi:hypothetical protein